MLAGVYYGVLYLSIIFYSCEVCSHISGMGKETLSLIALVIVLPVFILRQLLIKYRVEKIDLLYQSNRQLVIDISLFSAVGIILAVYNTIVHDYPLIGSGSKVLLASLAIGFFATIDLYLKKEKEVINYLIETKQNIPQKNKFISLPTKITMISAFSVLFSIIILILMIHQDFTWLSKNRELADVMSTKTSIFFEVLTVVLVIFLLAIKIIFSYAQNLKLFFESQARVFEQVSNNILDSYVPVVSNDEFGVIARHTNKMIDGLKERDKMKDLLINQEKRAMVGDLAAGLSHEVKNQLNSISYLDLLKDNLSKEEQKYVQYIYNSRDRILNLVDEVRGFVKKEDTNYSIAPYPLNIAIDEILDLVKMDLDVKKKNIVTELNFDGSVLMDKDKINQVLFNLVRNAAQAIDEKINNNSNGYSNDAKIVIMTESNGDTAYIHVKDNGCGIQDNMLDLIWNSFFSTKGKKGTGLGLGICKRIIEGHQGELTCNNKLEEGTSFTFSLPIAPGFS